MVGTPGLKLGASGQVALRFRIIVTGPGKRLLRRPSGKWLASPYLLT